MWKKIGKCFLMFFKSSSGKIVWPTLTIKEPNIHRNGFRESHKRTRKAASVELLAADHAWTWVGLVDGKQSEQSEDSPWGLSINRSNFALFAVFSDKGMYARLEGRANERKRKLSPTTLWSIKAAILKSNGNNNNFVAIVKCVRAGSVVTAGRQGRNRQSVNYCWCRERSTFRRPQEGKLAQYKSAA